METTAPPFRLETETASDSGITTQRELLLEWQEQLPDYYEPFPLD
ncbi:MAG: hypothetical protein JWM14_2792 [Chitinophagaceae bacterium]|nr:hypothetical protein [Chitinophagaceae bacterium]